MKSDSTPPLHDEVTPPAVFFNRRAFLRAGAVAGSVAATAWAYRALNPRPSVMVAEAELEGLAAPALTPQEALARGYRVDEAMTPLQDVASYNNFYEFSTDKDGVAPAAAGFVTDGWKIEVDGLVAKPATFDLDDLRRIAPPEERIYRMRCVEAWSMVIPWAGLSLSKLLERVEPTSAAKYVAFQTLLAPERMPGQRTDALEWPYLEGLMMTEAMHPLTLLATGLYGRELPPQNGAPVRLIVPWKYGFKGIKSIVKISLVATQPPTSWSRSAPGEYGFLANVNPQVDHPAGARRRRAHRRAGRRPTLMFNGYGEQVASLYAGMDLRANYLTGDPPHERTALSKLLVAINGGVPLAAAGVGRVPRPPRRRPGELRDPHDQVAGVDLPPAVAAGHAAAPAPGGTR